MAANPQNPDTDVLSRINALIETEHRLRSGQGEAVAEADVQHQLREVEAALDQCWDLLRQRRARQEFGQNPDDAQARPVAEVEDYRQ